MHEMTATTSSPAQRKFLLVALALWLLPLTAITVMVTLYPQERTVTGLYHEAAANWQAGKSLYMGPGGMNYLPHFALVFAPFEAMPAPWGDIMWRWLSAGLLAGGFWRLARQLRPDAPEQLFFWSSLFGLLLCLDAVRSGQANALFAALTTHAVVFLMQQRWWLATPAIFAALAIKPLGLVLLLLAPVVYRPMIWRAALGCVMFAALPFLFGNPQYVWSQHTALAENLRACSVVTEHRFADVNGLLRTLGLGLSDRASQLLRVLAGGATLGLCWLCARRLAEPSKGIFLLALTTSYLMLFNPMNEVNSYVILAPVLAALGAFHLKFEEPKGLGWVLVFMAVTMAVLPELLRKVYGNSFALWWHPLMTLAFVALLVWRVRRRPESESALAHVSRSAGQAAR
jgi:hypothetical protein